MCQDLTIISNHKDAHQDILSIWDEASLPWTSKLSQRKAYLTVLTVKNHSPIHHFSSETGRLVTSLLALRNSSGKTIGLTLHQSRKAATVKLTKKVYHVLNKINHMWWIQSVDLQIIPSSMTIYLDFHQQKFQFLNVQLAKISFLQDHCV